MRRPLPGKVRAWVAAEIPPEVIAALERLCAIDDVERVAVMPDVHLAEDVCVGTVVATRHHLLPAAVGGDIGCGMAALAFDGDASLLADAKRAAAVLSALYGRIPTLRHPGTAPALPESLLALPISAPLARVRDRDGCLELGTLGRGNHFVELQADEQERLWLMVHSGSRAMGQAIRNHHVHQAERCGAFARIRAESEEGRSYLGDMAWALAYAEENRRRLVQAAIEAVGEALAVAPVSDSLITCQHNHVRKEGSLWVHRKGAISAATGEAGIIPGSMGSDSFHVVGRGCADALCSSSHGAGRTMSRSDARRRISVRQLGRELSGVWYDHRLASQLRDEAPSAYKDIQAVMQAQRALTRIVRRLRPLLSFKGV